MFFGSVHKTGVSITAVFMFWVIAQFSLLKNYSTVSGFYISFWAHVNKLAFKIEWYNAKHLSRGYVLTFMSYACKDLSFIVEI